MGIFNMDKKNILIVSGGIGDQTGYEINVFHMAQNEKSFKKYNIQNAVLIPDGRITFPKTLSKSDIENSEKFNIFEGGCKIKKMGIDCIFYAPNTWKALTKYRAAFELLDIPIVGPSADSQGLAFNKITTRARMAAEGIKCAPGCIVRYEEKDDMNAILDKMKEQNFTFPVVVKAPCDDDSLGAYVVNQERDLNEKINKAFGFQNKNEILIEKFIPGREMRTAVIHDENQEYKLLPPMEFNLEGPNSIRT